MPIWQHPALRGHYRGWNGTSADHNYNWWDAVHADLSGDGANPCTPGGFIPLPASGSNIPCDDAGHGTHTVGIGVGDDGAGSQIGVAPGAKTIHCKSFTNSGGSSEAYVLTCFQWFLAPWDLNHNNPNPAKAPNAINNSWGWENGNYPAFVSAINSLQAAGILVEASAGNYGPACQTLGSPGDYDNILTTGSVDHTGYAFPGVISSFSSRGPSEVKETLRAIADHGQGQSLRRRDAQPNRRRQQLFAVGDDLGRKQCLVEADLLQQTLHGCLPLNPEP